MLRLQAHLAGLSVHHWTLHRVPLELGHVEGPGNELRHSGGVRACWGAAGQTRSDGRHLGGVAAACFVTVLQRFEADYGLAAVLCVAQHTWRSRPFDYLLWLRLDTSNTYLSLDVAACHFGAPALTECAAETGSFNTLAQVLVGGSACAALCFAC